ncbi:RNA polymerase sporulation-specific sigma factor [Caminicella sporogenes DSM 14501]|uniref:RNA polymerase sporulation-specific sigma factor n=2 Tax=Caminicella TaxID=166484 RepID=A0A1M6LPI7_9FIRM|nr:sigma-70 family RNA polymerase sigma factor [Caminicella sporogenes]RKD27905.1 flagellar biosynthesis protein FliA [Caminicella sporogenes]SHJ73104.1 RNA polymerase sporulation-specific sigma factor [Caminicella sporogenes DSM 14501]
MWLSFPKFSFFLMKFLFLVVSFVSNNTSFPKPLSPEEEEKYLMLYSQGDNEAKNILIEKNLRLVAHVVKKYHNSGYNIDDLISIGTIGLIKAITTFDASKGTRLATYAARCIENAIHTKCNEEVYEFMDFYNMCI